MLSIKEHGLLLSIIKHCEKISGKMDGLTREAFDRDEDVVQIICFNILQIGELAKNFDLEFLKRHDQVPWKHIKGMRDRVAHGYDTIDMDMVWDTALTDIPPLLTYCRSILSENK